ncbi:MAG: GH25 family lysozyme, partial [Sarcina sp.]
ATEGQTYTDPLLMQNYQKAKNAGMAIGFYHFMHAYDDGAVQARFMYEKIKDLDYDCRIAIDIEVADNQNNMTINTCILDFACEIEKLTGHKPVIYSYLSFINEHFDDNNLTQYGLWLAEYGVSKASPVKLWGTNIIGWQYADNGNFTSSTDLDIFDEDIYIKKPQALTENESQSTNISVGAKVELKESTPTYATGQAIPDWVKGKTYTVEQISNNKVLLKEIESWVYLKDVILADNCKYGIVTASVLNVRSGAGTNYPVIGQVKKGDKIKLDCKVGDWWSTYYGEHGGFMYAEYLK